MREFEEILSGYHVELGENRHDESIKLAAQKYAKEKSMAFDEWKYPTYYYLTYRITGTEDTGYKKEIVYASRNDNLHYTTSELYDIFNELNKEK